MALNRDCGNPRHSPVHDSWGRASEHSTYPDNQAADPSVSLRRRKHISVSVHVIPHLGSNKKLFSFYNALLERLLKYLADLILVSIAGRAVKGTVAHADRSCHGSGHRIGSAWSLPRGSHTYCRHFAPV